MISGSFRVSYPGFELNTGYFEISSSEITIIYGDSGSGKSTFLNCIAGIEKNFTGNIFYKRVPTIGYVFQESALFPHLDVKGNLLYAYDRCHKKRHQFNEVVESLGVIELLNKNVGDLSGGERQRVSIARSILSSPDILLMDEPLSALHSEARSEILKLIIDINKLYQIPILIVTHSKGEVVSLCDSVLFFKENLSIHKMTREEALFKIDARGPINLILKENLANLRLSLAPNLFDNFIIHSANVVVQKKQVEALACANTVRCRLIDIIPFNKDFIILKLEYFKNSYLYSKVENEVFKKISITPNEEVVALFGTDSHIV